MKHLPGIAAALFVVASSLSAADLPPTAADVPYGPHSRNVLDFWKADSDGPRPLVVNIQGGGWVGCDKKLDAAKVQPYLDKGISVASINYRLTAEVPLPAPVHDAARAIQFLRTKAKEWNIDTDHIA